MDKLIMVLMVPGSIILCLVWGKRLSVRAAAILLLLLALGVVLPNIQFDRSAVSLLLQSTFLTEFAEDTRNLIESGQQDVASRRLAEFARRFPEAARKPDELTDLMVELRAITNTVPFEQGADQRTNGSTVPTGARGRAPAVP